MLRPFVFRSQRCAKVMVDLCFQGINIAIKK